VLLQDSFHPHPASERLLGLRSGTNNYLAHINIVRLFDRERNSAGDRIRRHRELISGLDELGPAEMS
jgi:hypothetical protein